MAERVNPFKGQPQASDGEYKTEVPSVDTHDARVVALIDLGTHNEAFQGAAPRDVRKCLIAFELDEEMSGTKGVNHVVAVRYTMSFHEKGNLRKLAETILNEGQKFTAAEIDYTELLGKPCTVQISHKTVKSEKGERNYAQVGVISAVPKKKRDTFFKPYREPIAWFVGDPLEDLPTWLPRVYGEDVKDIIARCIQLHGRPAPIDDEGEVGDEQGANIGEQIPF